MKNNSPSTRETMALNIRNAVETAFPGKGQGKQLARLLGVSPSMVSQWINGKKLPSLLHLHEMSRILDLPLHRLCALPECEDGETEDPVCALIHQIATCRNGKERSMLLQAADARQKAAAALICKILRQLTDCPCADE